MSDSSPESISRAVAKPVLTLLGPVAAIVGLLSVPWPWGLRLAILGSLAIAALLLTAYQLGRRHGESAVPPSTPKASDTSAPAGGHWNPANLAGTQLIVASRSGGATICRLRPGGVLAERGLPQAPKHAHSPREFREGTWSYGEDGLRILVGEHDLLFQPSIAGMWACVQLHGPADGFIAMILDPDPIGEGAPWVGLKLGERGARRIVTADADGSLIEINPFGSGREASGRWKVDGEWLNIDVEERWRLRARRESSGLLLGIEQSDEGASGFAVARALNRPDRTE